MEKVTAKYDLTDLNSFKDYLFNKIDAKTQSIIAQGFAFDGNTFSLSLAAQSNWTNIKTNKVDFAAAGLFPLQISTIDNNTYMLSEANVENFWSAGLVAVKGAYTSGADIKKLVFDATTIEELELIEDNR
ncbi:MAG: DUF4376 domain-containing protein [Nanoarchaeota archaeon]|nr:DUF4376 domain-containing protein [Nanoarchaeota archaeon]